MPSTMLWSKLRVKLRIGHRLAIFSELFIGVSSFGFGRFGWSLSLIALGILLLLRNLGLGLPKA